MLSYSLLIILLEWLSWLSSALFNGHGSPSVISNSTLEPMDCLPLGASVSSDDDKIEDSDNDPNKSNDINMESSTNPPTPASIMQV